MLCNTNYHCHSTFCDGQDSLAEIADFAYAAGLKILGFSSHTAYPGFSEWHMRPECYGEYFSEIERLKTEYSGRMEILAGLEAEFFPPATVPNKVFYAPFKPDYIIGSVHYIFTEDSFNSSNLKADNQLNTGAVFTADGSEREILQGIDKLFGGDAKKAVQRYFELQRQMISTCSFDIIGHIDVIRKRNEGLRLFDENEQWYRSELQFTAETVAASGKVVEINTGGMSRAGMTSPYPSFDFMQILAKKNIPLMLNSDCHKKENMQDNFEAGLAFAKAGGLKELWYLSGKKWYSTEI